MKLSIIALLFVLTLQVSSQQIGIGQWRDHLPYSEVQLIEYTPNLIYCATQYALFTYDPTSGSVERISKVNGLSSSDITTLKFDANSATLFVGYENGNLDLIQTNTIININDINKSGILGDKSINNASFEDGLAYLSCGFGIVVFDITKLEVKDTYHIIISSDLEVHSTSIINDTIYAAANGGLYYAPINGANLTDYNAWIRDNSLPVSTANFTQVHNFMGALHVMLKGGAGEGDTIYKYVEGSWETAFSSSNINSFEVSNSKAILTNGPKTKVHNADWSIKLEIESNTTKTASFVHAVFGDTEDEIWAVWRGEGLFKHNLNLSGPYLPNGPSVINAYDMSAGSNGTTWVASGGRVKSIGANYWYENGIQKFQNNTWSSINKSTIPAMDTVKDIIAVAEDPTDSKRVFAGSLGDGLLEFYNDELVSIYNTENSSLEDEITSPTWYFVCASGLKFDKSNNLWVSNSRGYSNLSVKTPDNVWQSFTIPGMTSQIYVEDVVITQANHVWTLVPGTGFGVLDFNNTPTDISDDQSVFQTITGHGLILSVAEDLDGELWIGTSDGIVVIYSPSAVFTSGVTPQQILIEKDGYTQYLLETQTISAIAIDGANRKWIGTDGSGVFLLSEDGTEELLQFNTENSPLLSNTITSIGIDNTTGEVFFGTEMGTMSYKGSAIAGSSEYSNVHAYPNPVEHGYDGPIAIKGLVGNSDLKITDVSGNLVYQTTSSGGQAIWYGKDHSGQRVQSGVYLVFCTTPNIDQTYVGKILFLN